MSTPTELKRVVDELYEREFGYTWDTPAWVPEKGGKYWFVTDSSIVDWAFWDDDEEDQSRKNFLGIYQTRELAEAALLEIRRALLEIRRKLGEIRRKLGEVTANL